MYKYAAQVALEVLLKVAEYDEQMRRMVETVARKYKQYGVKPPTAADLERMFKGFDPKGGGSWQEFFLKSEWMRSANNAKAAGGFRASHGRSSGTGSSSSSRAGRSSGGGGASSGARPGAKSGFDDWYEDFKRRNAERKERWARQDTNWQQEAAHNNRNWERVRREANAEAVRSATRVARTTGKVLASAGLLGMVGLGAYASYQHQQAKKVKSVAKPEDFSSRKYNNLKNDLTEDTVEPYAAGGSLATALIAGGAMLHSNALRRAASRSPFGNTIAALGLVTSSSLGGILGGSLGKAIHNESNANKLNAAIAGALTTGKEDQALNREIKHRLGLRKAAGLLKQSEDSGLDEHHFRNRLGLLGPLSGAMSGGLRPLSDTIQGRLDVQLKAKNPTFKGLLKGLPWKESLRKMPGGIIPGAISGVVVGHFLDKYLQSKLRRKDDGLLSKLAPMSLANSVMNTVEPMADSVTNSVKGLLG